MSSRIPSLNWLRVFEAAARTESFARAAVQLNMSAAAVSQQVKALETRLGTPLFHRHAHAVTLTEAGRAYLPSVQQSLLMLETATTGLFGETREQRLYVQSVLLFAHGILAKGLSAFQARHPDINLSLSTGNIVSDFANRFTDLQIVFGNPALFGTEGDELIREVLYPVAPPAIAAQIKTPQDLLSYTLIEVSTHRASWPHWFETLRLPAGQAQYFFADNSIMAAELSASGLGIALARAPASDRIMGMSGLVPCLPEAKVAGQEAYHLIYPSLTTMRTPARMFRDWLLDYSAAVQTR
ncbi:MULTISPECIES: LysR family transcriptional regulator [unclassified Ruegeria]|uniref:LysR family transcriptional regulator n=1 Tax=unclassified Ruegeria TaxID=2625375 RepID=UPI001488F777|nr:MULTISPECIES: LysR family transcriptional regulator [unclassified Ruegeria]NOD64574.1 LysR family transcriptional regulator [Ruegeria sp. HKCCD6109]NOD88142.1 LysR family transcriptional regulator [Ruegeria sp. HKCCD4318]NOE14990.1 LysR family transcriptional regulator [Ruegeria sp. HKCCD4318-2]NOG11407.1 LysR family transcriptional regulator [Ruegeria sp. HKCCD4315]